MRQESVPTKSHKAHLKMLMSIINTMPEEEQANYNGIKSMVSDDSPQPKENAPVYHQPVIKLKTLSITAYPRITEIPYRNYIEVEGYLYNLYISDAQTANDLAELQNYHIHALLTFGQSNDPSKYTFLKGGYLCLPLEESSNELMLVMDKVCKFIDTYINKGNILVHCCEGNSRSCAAIIGYLIKKYKISFDIALDIVKKGRPTVKLAYIFERQLRRIERAELYN